MIKLAQGRTGVSSSVEEAHASIVRHENRSGNDCAPSTSGAEARDSKDSHDRVKIVGEIKSSASNLAIVIVLEEGLPAHRQLLLIQSPLYLL